VDNKLKVEIQLSCTVTMDSFLMQVDKAAILNDHSGEDRQKGLSGYLVIKLFICLVARLIT